MYAILDTIRHICLCHKCGQRFCWQLNLLIADIQIRGAQIPGATSLWWLNIVQWCLIFVGCQYRTCVMLHLWHLEFWGR